MKTWPTQFLFFLISCLSSRPERLFLSPEQLGAGVQVRRWICFGPRSRGASSGADVSGLGVRVWRQLSTDVSAPVPAHVLVGG